MQSHIHCHLVIKVTRAQTPPSDEEMGLVELFRSTSQSSNPIGQYIIHNYMRRCPNNTLN